MKRAGNLIGRIAAPENIRLAFWKAAKGKWSRPATRAFAANLEPEIARLSAGLADGSFPFGAYRSFRGFDPKERWIHAAAFPERVAHHAIMNLSESVFERAAVFDSYACRKGKGQVAAGERARHYARRYPWFLKMDVRKYFDSIPHAGMLELLERLFKDAGVLRLFETIVDSYETRPGLGLPIGSLTSQYFANHFLTGLDRLALLHLSAPLPMGMGFPTLGKGAGIGDVITLVGFGRSGYGSYGYTSNASLTDRRFGSNVIDSFELDDEGSGAFEIFSYDFDDPSTVGQAGGSLGNDIETIIGPGDSGGAALRQTANGWELVGINTYTEGYGGRFGDTGGGVLVDPYTDWIFSITGIPEPGSAALLLVTAVLSFLRRERRWVGNMIQQREERRQETLN